MDQVQPHEKKNFFKDNWIIIAAAAIIIVLVLIFVLKNPGTGTVPEINYFPK